MPTSLDTIQEEFVVEQLKQLEKDLIREADKPYSDINKKLIKKVEEIFTKYDRLPESLKYLSIRREFEKQKIFQQINKRYKSQGKEFTAFLKGSLKENFNQAVQHSQKLLNSVSKAQKRFEVVYQETNDVETHWRNNTLNHTRKVKAILSQGIAKHNTVDEITNALTSQSDLLIYQAKRLARTETSLVINQASLTVYKEMGVKQVKWLDSTEQFFISKQGKKNKSQTVVCPFCKKYANGGVNKDGVYPIGKLPSPIPAHPNCRCTVAPVIIKTKRTV